MTISRRDALMGASALALVSCASNSETTPPNGAAAGAPIGALFATTLDIMVTRILQESPETATSLGVTEERAGGRFIDRVSDLSPEGRARRIEITRDNLASLRALPRDALSAADKVTYDVIVTALENQTANQSYDYGNGAMTPYVVTQLTGSYASMPDFMDTRHPLTTRDQADAYLTRVAGFVRQLDQETARIGADAARGVSPPDFAIDKALTQLEVFTGKAPAETVLIQTLDRRLPQLAEMNDADKATFKERATALVRDEVMPAYQRQIAALRAVRPNAVHDAGVWRLPGGAEAYEIALRSRTTTTLSADEIHQMGLDLIRSLQAEMDTILRAEGLTSGSVAQRVRQISERPDQLYPNTDEGRAQILAELNRQTQHVASLCPQFFGAQARAPLEIKRVPEYTQAGAPGGYYQRASLDGSRPGQYYINLRDTSEWPKFTLPTLNYHEGIPGHHWQISIQQEAGSLPFMRQALLNFGAYTEGWALYAETVADEMGVYADDRLGRLGYLQSATFRASRLVVDTGMHAKRWSREQAIQSMVEATGDQESSVIIEIERYSVWPGQACSYMVGREAITALRREAEQRQGAAFDVKAFHDTVLTNGSVPLSVLQTIVRDWLNA